MNRPLLDEITAEVDDKAWHHYVTQPEKFASEKEIPAALLLIPALLSFPLTHPSRIFSTSYQKSNNEATRCITDALR